MYFPSNVDLLITLFRFITEESIISDTSRFFAKTNFPLEMQDGDKEALFNEVNVNLDGFIVKPNKGGKNIEGNDIAEALKNEDVINNSIIMPKIKPAESELLVLRGNKLNKEKCFSEIGIYGIILSDDTTIHLNKTAGFLVRATPVEGGSCPAIDTPNLVEG